MMKTYLKRAFQLSDSGVKGLAKSIWSFFLYYVSFVPPMICVFLFADRLLNGNTGKPVVYLLFMLAATLVMYLVINRKALIISKKPGNTGISRDMRTEFTTHLLHSD